MKKCKRITTRFTPQQKEHYRALMNEKRIKNELRFLKGLELKTLNRLSQVLDNYSIKSENRERL